MEEAGLELEAELCNRLVMDTTHHEEVIRQAGAVALANALAENPEYVPVVLQQLMDAYEEKLFVSFLAHLVFYQTSLCNHDLSVVHSCWCHWHQHLCTALLATELKIETSYLV